MITLFLTGPVLLPVFGAVLYGLLGWRRETEWLAAVCASGLLVCGVGLAIVVNARGPYIAVAGLVRADALTAFMIIVIGTVGLLATAASPAFLAAEIHNG